MDIQLKNSRIKLLDDGLISKIAAGEVVERPLQIVKELVENAIDAGAKTIEVRLKEGGIREIQIIDDGGGMEPEELPLALKRHATSKISKEEDLYTVRSMGFRGEALAAIASVSKLCIQSRRQGASAGALLRAEEGEITSQDTWSGPAGTVVTINDLFYRTPARRAFLKSPPVEYGHVADLLRALALCYPRVGFSLQNDNKIVLTTEAAPACPETLEGVTALDAELFSKALLEKMEKLFPRIPFLSTSLKTQYANFYVVMSAPGYDKAHANAMYFFLNQRWFQHNRIKYAAVRGYQTHLLKGRFPIISVHIQCDPSLVDINVHPQKSAARFQYESEVCEGVQRVVQQRLRQGDWQKQDLPDDEQAGFLPAVARPAESSQRFASVRAADFLADAPISLQSLSKPSKEFTLGAGPSRVDSPRFARPDAGIERAAPQSFWESSKGLDSPAVQPRQLSQEGFRPDWSQAKFKGSLFRCYLVFELPSDHMLVVDQHAWHERILFERLKTNIDPSSQRLLMPTHIELTPQIFQQIAEGKGETLSELGFVFELEAPNLLKLQGVPSLLAERASSDLFFTILDATEGHESGEGMQNRGLSVLDRLRATIACHAAVRSGEDLGESEIQQLILQSKEVDFDANCPHGRRVFRWFHRREVERWFDR